MWRPSHTQATPKTTNFAITLAAEGVTPAPTTSAPPIPVGVHTAPGAALLVRAAPVRGSAQVVALVGLLALVPGAGLLRRLKA